MKITVEQNTKLTQHMQAEIGPGKVILVHYDRTTKKEEGKDDVIELTEKGRFEYPAKDADQAYEILEHFRWAAGKCLKAIKEKLPDINNAIKVAAPAAEPAPGSKEEEEALAAMVNEDNQEAAPQN